jgi:3-oxoadipate enol-lactonase
VPIASLNDVNMYYEIAGDNCDFPLIMVPGLRGDSVSFATLVPRLKRHCQVIIIDNRGVGRTVSNENLFTTAQLADDIIALMDHLNIKKANLLGHSMGGFIVQKLAANYPERANKVVLSCCGTSMTENSEKLLIGLYEKIISAQISEREFNEQILKFYSAPLIYENDFMREAMLDFMEEYPYKQSIENFKKQVDACIEHNGIENLKSITSETLVIAGELDPIATLDEIEKMDKYISHSQLKVINGVGHLPFVEDSKRFVNIVTDFLFS